MKATCKAVLLSTFVFPGVGHLYLKKYSRGLVIMFSVFAGLGYIIWPATVSAINRLDDIMVKMQGGTPNLQELSDIAGSKLLNADLYRDAVFYLLCLFWIFAVIDAYRTGRQMERRGEETSQGPGT